MKKQKQPNVWMYATIVLGILCLVLIGYHYYEVDRVIELGDFKIRKSQLESFFMIMQEAGTDEYHICSFETKKCVKLTTPLE